MPGNETLPRILCLHGGGVTAAIFHLQLQKLVDVLESHFRFAFAEGPFLCGPGPGIQEVFSHMGPDYKRWLRWKPDEHAENDDETAIAEIEYCLQSAMQDDDSLGGRGPWVGLLGFSQGGKMAASILYDGELKIRASKRLGEYIGPATKEISSPKLDGMYGGLNDDDDDVPDDMPKGLAGGQWRFAISMAGRAPLVQLSEYSRHSLTMINAGGISEGGKEFDNVTENRDLLSLPTLHVHGLQDSGLELHRRLLNLYCAKGSAEALEWNGAHRVPLSKTDVKRVADGILAVAKVSVVPLMRT